MTQELTGKLGKSTAEGLMTYFETTSKEKAVELATKADVKVAVSESTKEIIKWMFIFLGRASSRYNRYLLIDLQTLTNGKKVSTIDEAVALIFKVPKMYKYLGDRLTDVKYKGKECEAVRRENGKCIRGKNGSMLVKFTTGETVNVIGRLIRKIILP